MNTHVNQLSDPPPPRERRRSWWWLSERERRARAERRRAYKEWQKRNRKEGTGDSCDGCDCSGDLCLIGLIPVVLTSVVRFARGRGTAADPAAPVPDGVAAAALYGAVRHYRTQVSPTRRACCPYTPSCSTYAVKALHRHGAVRGARLTVGRLLRCRPGTRGGSDPVPE